MGKAVSFYSADFPARATEWQCPCGQFVPANAWHSHGVMNGEKWSKVEVEAALVTAEIALIKP